jgi:predicted PurR-regulated permease PerM
MHHDKDKLKQTIFILTLAGLAALLYWYLRGFLDAFLGAVIIYILSRRPLFYLTAKTRRPWQSILVVVGLMVISFVIIVLPILLLSLLLPSKISYVIIHYKDILTVVQQWSEQVRDYLGFDLVSADTVTRLTGIAATVIPKLISETATVLIDILIMYFILFFMLANARSLEANVRSYLPFTNQNNQLLVQELKRQTISNSAGIVALAIVQGLAAFIGYWIFGVNQPWFWAIITGLLSFIPVFGVGVAWVSLSVLLYVSGKHLQGIGLFLYCITIISAIDQGFRILVSKKLGDIHPLITFFGVLMGLEIFGFVGIIFGPMLISYFILLLRIYRNEYLGIAYDADAGQHPE